MSLLSLLVSILLSSSSISSSTTSFTQLIFNQSYHCIEKVSKVGTSKVLIIPQYVETLTFPEKLRIYHEYPINNQEGELFDKQGAVKYTIEMKGDKGLELAEDIKNVSFIIDDFTGLTLEDQSPGLKWILVGDIDIPKTCLPTLSLTGFISKSCGQEEAVRVARSPFRGKVRVVANWIRLHMKSVKMTMRGGVVMLTSWGKLTSLSSSPCSHRSITVWVQAQYKQAGFQTLTLSDKKIVNLGDLPDTLEFTLQDYPSSILCQNTMVTININPDFEYYPTDHIIMGQSHNSVFKAVSKVKCRVDISEVVTVHIESVEGHVECLKQLVVTSMENDTLASLDLASQRSLQISTSLVNFCKHHTFEVSFHDTENEVVNSMNVNLLELVLVDGKLIIQPVNARIFKGCDKIVHLSILCKSDKDTEDVFTITRYFYIYEDLMDQYGDQIEDKYCSISGTSDANWTYIGKHASEDNTDGDDSKIDDCQNVVSILRIGVVFACISFIFLIVALLLMRWYSRTESTNDIIGKNMGDDDDTDKIEMKENEIENIYSSFKSKQPAFNPGFVDEELGIGKMLERSVSLNQDSFEDTRLCLRKRGSSSMNYCTGPDFHDGD